MDFEEIFTVLVSVGQKSPSQRTSLKYGSLENIFERTFALNSCQNIYRNEPAMCLDRMQGLQRKYAGPLGAGTNVCIARERAYCGPSVSPALVETNRTVFHIQDCWFSARTWGELEVRVGCQGDCLGLEDEWFHQFNQEGGGGGGRWAPGLAKHHILAKTV